MQKEAVVKAISIFLVLVVVLNMTLFVMKQISQSLFWTRKKMVEFVRVAEQFNLMVKN